MLDCHVHVFRPAIAAKLSTAIGQEFNCTPAGIGTPADLLEHLDAAGCKQAICLNAALTPGQLIPANNWAIELLALSSRFIPFGTVHPDHPTWEQELDRLERHGIRGLKIHPDLSAIPLDSPKWDRVFDVIADRFVILTHMGGTRPGQHTASPPKALRQALDNFPKLRVIAAHCGGMYQWEESLRCLAGQNIWFDTSSTLHIIPPPLFQALCSKHDPTRFLFGSDYPLFSPRNEKAMLLEALAHTEISIRQLEKNAVHLCSLLDGTLPSETGSTIDIS